MAEQVMMRFPGDTEYIGAIRLAVSGVAGQLNFTVDEIEDLKSCVAESCLLLLCGQRCRELAIVLTVDGGIGVSVAGVDIATGEYECNCMEFNEEISRIMVQALSDGAKFDEENGILSAISFNKTHMGSNGK